MAIPTNTQLIFKAGIANNIPTNNATNGAVYYTTDTKALYIGEDGKANKVADYTEFNSLKSNVSSLKNTLTNNYLTSATIANDYTTKAELAAVQNQTNAINSKVSILIGNDANNSVRAIAANEIAKQLIANNASASLDTLQEIAAWIQSHPNNAAAMNSNITSLQKSVNSITSNYATKAELSAHMNTVAGDYATKNELNTHINTASSTYLTKASATNTYLTQTNATNTYLTKANATNTYLTKASATNTYLTQANATNTYATKAELSAHINTAKNTIYWGSF